MLPPKYFWRTNPDCKGLCDSKPHYFRFDAMSDDKDRGPRVDRWIRDTERGLFYRERKARVAADFRGIEIALAGANFSVFVVGKLAAFSAFVTCSMLATIPTRMVSCF